MANSGTKVCAKMARKSIQPLIVEAASKTWNDICTLARRLFYAKTLADSAVC